MIGMNLMIFGPPGSGKGTYASRLEPILKIKRIATGDIFRDEMKKNQNWVKRLLNTTIKASLYQTKL